MNQTWSNITASLKLVKPVVYILIRLGAFRFKTVTVKYYNGIQECHMVLWLSG